MSTDGLQFPALNGLTPLGALATLGVARLLTPAYPQLAMRWASLDGEVPVPVFVGGPDTLEEATAALVDVLAGIEHILPGCGPDFPPAGRTGGDPLRCTREDLAAYAATLTPAEQDWLSVLVCPTVTDDTGRVVIHPLFAPTGRQTIRTTLASPLTLLRERPTELLTEALTGWHGYPAGDGMYLTHSRRNAADTPDGKPAEFIVPGAQWLAQMALPLLRPTADHIHRGRVLIPGTRFQRPSHSRPGRRYWTWPLWTTPAIPAALLTDIPYTENILQLDPDLLMMAAHRRKHLDDKFAGVFIADQPRRPIPADAGWPT